MMEKLIKGRKLEENSLKAGKLGKLKGGKLVKLIQKLKWGKN